MDIAIATFPDFNEIDSFVALNILGRVKRPDWRIQIAAPAPRLVSMNGVTIEAQQPLEYVNQADVVLIGSGRRTRDMMNDPMIMSAFRLDPERQLIGAQCSGGLLLAKLGLLKHGLACSDATTRPFLEELGITVLEQPIWSAGNIATAGGCLSSQYLAAWVVWRTLGQTAAEDALSYVAPTGQSYTSIDVMRTAMGASCIDAFV